MKLDRRTFLKASSAVSLGSGIEAQAQQASQNWQLLDDFKRSDSNYHGDDWESLNSGYWSIKENSLVRRLKNSGDKARRTGFPYHYETHKKGGVSKMPVDYDPSLPEGILWHRKWKMSGSYSIAAEFEFISERRGPEGDEKESWDAFQDGFGFIGLTIGGQSLFEGYGKSTSLTSMVWKDDQSAGLIDKKNKFLKSEKCSLNKGEKFRLELKVGELTGGRREVVGTISTANGTKTFKHKVKDAFTKGYVGIITRGFTEFKVNSIEIQPQSNKPLNVKINDCHACYALGDTLEKVNGKWQVRFVSMFRNDGKLAEIRVSESPNPTGGWQSVKVGGKGSIENSDFRLNTAVIDVTLPISPSEATLYYTVWKDGVDVTADDRVGTDACGPGTGMIGDIPVSGSYVGRLPQLTAPYKLCGLSCHAINSGVVKEGERKFLGSQAEWRVRDQPTYGSYKHLEDYNFQVMVWEDDIWYMELYIYPPSTDDAYKVVTTSICGPTSRWQLMRHWNVLNPGDHDHGMDDVKGPEQILIRNHKNLGQDPEYMQRNFKIVSHLMTGKINPSGTDNPKRWRQWQMPKNDFTLVICDSRLWRSSQDTNIWDDQGWGHVENLYSRKDPTRTLLGEEQHAWLTQVIRTNTSPIICLTGLNGLHTIWNSGFEKGDDGERNRVAADYAGWVSAASDRVLELLAERDGVFTVYGDVHNGSIIKNSKLNIYECSFGPIGRTGGRAPAPGFARNFNDIDGRNVDVYSLYHKTFDSPELTKIEGPMYWNFLEMSFNPQEQKEQFDFKVRNMIDAPKEAPRGGGSASGTIDMTGLAIQGKLPITKTLANATVRFTKQKDGSPLRGTMSDENGVVLCRGFSRLSAGDKVIMTANVNGQADAQVITLI
ncbi:MAG: alkaline phosphatase D family protein [Lentisphaeraceae bacterium]|nr:alkaline phosphatase D family protein [Lentisphaeraceae bacterium]